MTTIAIVDYGMGNLLSVARALEHVAPDANIRLCTDAAGIAAADRVVFPGQGAMLDCMRNLDASGLREAVLDASRTKPMLGVCLGEQMLFDHSQEGPSNGLGIMKGEVVRFAGSAFDGAAASVAALTQARSHIVATHGSLAAVARKLGLDDLAVGPVDKPEDRPPRGVEPQVTRVNGE